MPNTGGQSLPLSWWPHYSWFRPRCHWLSWPAGHSSHWAGSQWAPPSPFLPSSSWPTPCPACSTARVCWDWSAGPSTLPYWASCSHPWPIDRVCLGLCRAFLPLSRSTLPPSFVLSTNLLRVPSIPMSRPSIKMLNRTGTKTKAWGTASDQPPSGFTSIHHNPLGLAIQFFTH